MLVTIDPPMQDIYGHLNHSFLASLGKCGTNNNKLFLPAHRALGSMHPQAHQWAVQHFKAAFPALQAHPAVTSPQL